MPSNDRRAAARRRAWGRGPMILRFEPLEGRQLLSVAPRSLPDLVMTSFSVPTNLDWGDSFNAAGTVLNQGGGPTTAPFKIDLYAAPNPIIGPAAVYLGSVEIPPGIVAGAQATFDQQLTMPGSPMPGSDTTGAVYIDLRINHDHSVVESNYHNDQSQGLGLDSSLVQITPVIPAHLVGTTLAVTPNSVNWGGTFTITAQVTNEAQGDAPPTRARVVLTPGGLTPGGPSDVTIDNIALPTIPAWQTFNLVHTVTLPPVPPSALAYSTQFTLSLVEDADFLTNAAPSNQMAQGLGLDQASITINPGTTPFDPHKSLPDLAATGVQVPTQPIPWGTSIQVSTSVQNLGFADAGPFRVRFLLTGPNGALSTAIFLADAQIDGLKAGFTQPIAQTLRIPSRLPNGMLVNGDSPGRILVIVDPENTIDDALRTNNVAVSAPVQLKLLGSDGTVTVPTTPAPTTSTTTTATTTQAHAALSTTTTNGRHISTRLRKKNHGLKVFPKKIEQFFRDLGHRLSLTGSSRKY